MVKKHCLLKQWLVRDGKESIRVRVTGEMAKLVIKRSFTVMLVKMLLTVPESERLKFVSEQEYYGMTLLHHAAKSGNIDAIKAILNVYPVSDHLLVVNLQDKFKRTVLQNQATSSPWNSFGLFIQNQETGRM